MAGTGRRAALLAALEDELERRALADVSLSAVARRAGLARSTFYFYFESKNAAVVELLSGVYDDLIALGADLIEGVGAPREALAVAIGHAVATWRRHRPLFCALLDAARVDPKVREVWEGWTSSFEDLLVGAASERRWPLVLPAGVGIRATFEALNATNIAMLERHVRADADETAAEELTTLLAHLWTTTLFGPVDQPGDRPVVRASERTSEVPSATLP